MRGGKYEAKGRTTNRTDTDSIKRKEDRRDTGINSQPEIIAKRPNNPTQYNGGVANCSFLFQEWNVLSRLRTNYSTNQTCLVILQILSGNQATALFLLREYSDIFKTCSQIR